LREKIEITLIDARSTSLDKPTLPEVAFTGKPVEHARFPLKTLVERHDAHFIQARIESVDPQAQKVILEDGTAVPYDYLFITVGALKDYDATPGFREYGYSLCDDAEAPRLWNTLQQFRGGPVVVGSARSHWGSRIEITDLAAPCEGPVGEVMFMLAHEFEKRGIREQSTISVFTPGEIFFEDVGEKVHASMEPLIKGHDIRVYTSKEIVRITADRVEFSDGSGLESALTILLPVYTGNPVIKKSGLGDEMGFIPTDLRMRHLDHKNIFAAGDANAREMPKLGHIAVMQADIAAANLKREITGKGEIPEHRPEIFCIMNRGGAHATMIISDTLFGGKNDLTFNGPVAHFLKWSFDTYYFYTRGHMPPDMAQSFLKSTVKAAHR
ncbi:MAG: FAD-dependent oxidoreductase, partial [Calditrichia bacterium]